MRKTRKDKGFGRIDRTIDHELMRREKVRALQASILMYPSTRRENIYRPRSNFLDTQL